MMEVARYIDEEYIYFDPNMMVAISALRLFLQPLALSSPASSPPSFNCMIQTPMTSSLTFPLNQLQNM